MKILLHDYAGHSFQVQLSRELAARGHTVGHLYCESTHTPQGELVRRDSDPPGFSVRGIRLAEMIRKNSLFRRFQLERDYAKRLIEECERFEPEVVLSGNTPSIPQYRLAKWCQRRGVRLVTWVQDIYGLAAYRLAGRQLPVLGHAIGLYFIALDRWAFRHSESVVVITEDFREVLVNWGLDPAHIHVIHNWSPLEQIPLRPRDNDWSRALQLAPGLRFLYSGTMSMKHNPALVLELARLLEREQAGEMIVVSEGIGPEWLQKQTAAAPLRSLRILGFQPHDVFADVLASADVLVAVLDAEAGVFSVPSKVLSYLCAGRPLLLAVPGENLAARIVLQSDAGVVVAPTDIAGFCRAAEALIASPEKRHRHATAARRYAETHFDIRRIGDRFEAILGGR
jgi:glycosyltransferase involved in cell wall biosynthesis